MRTVESEIPRLRMFGPFRVAGPNGLTVPLSSRRARALLAFLHLAPEGAATRERLAGILWSDRGDDQARASLRQTLRQLLTTLGSAGIGGLTANREAVKLEPTAFQSDLRDLRAAMGNPRGDALCRLLKDIGTQTLLEDLEIGGLFGDWLAQVRSELEHVMAAAVASEVNRLGTASEWSSVRELANVWLRRDPLDETIVAAAMRADGSLGSVSAIQRRYTLLKQALARDLGTVPSEVVEAALIAARLSPLPTKDVSIVPVDSIQKPLLAVLAFDNLSGDPEMLWFSDGVSEEIQQTIARSDQLRVLGRTSSFEFRGVNKSVSRVAAELSATHVLDGSVRRNGARVRISAQLISCADQSTLWSDRFDRELTDVLLLQDEIAEAVAAALQSTFSKSMHPSKIDPTAYDLLLQSTSTSGNDHVHIGEAIRLLERAVGVAPDFAAAWAALANLRVTVYRRVSLDEMPFSVSRQEAISAVETSLRLDPELGISQTVLAHLLPWGDYINRESGFRKAMATSPNDPKVIIEMGWFLMSVGRNQEALECGLQAVALDPLSGWASNLQAQAFAAVGRYGEAQLCLDQNRERQPFSSPPTSVALYLAAVKGDWSNFDRVRKFVKELPLYDQSVREALGLGKMLREPQLFKSTMLERVNDELSCTGTVELQTLSFASKMGLTEPIFDIVDRISFSHIFEDDGASPTGFFSPGVIFAPDLNRSMMDDVRFVGLCAKLGLCDYWVTTNSWPDCSSTTPYNFKAETRRLTEPVKGP